MEQNTKLLPLTSRLLLVEDDLKQAGEIMQYFGKLGYEVHPFHTGEDAIFHLAQMRITEEKKGREPLKEEEEEETDNEQPKGYDAILLDMDLEKGGGDLDGIATAQKLDELHFDIPILLMTRHLDTFEDIAGRQTEHWVVPKSSWKDLSFSLKNRLAGQNRPRCMVRANGLNRLLRVNHIICIESEKKAVRIHYFEIEMSNGKIQYSSNSYTEGKETVGSFYKKMGSPTQFERIHNSHFVNRDYLIGFTMDKGEPQFYFKGLPIPKKGKRKKEFIPSETVKATKRLVDYWLGVSKSRE